MASTQAESVRESVFSKKDSMLAFMRDLVEAESPSARPESHRLAHSILLDRFARLGFRARLTGSPGGARHLYARPGERKGGKPQLLLGHYDTVWPLGTVSRRPFEIDGNIVRGPGSFDMKGGLAQIVIALESLADAELTPSLDPVVFVNADEEIGSRTSTRYIRWLAQSAARAFVMEPAMGEDGAIKTERKGIGRFTVTVFGKAAHAGLDPGGGASAILELSHVIQKLFALNDPDEGVTVNVGTVDGGLQPNVVAPHSKAVVDVRVPTVKSGEQIERIIHGIKPETDGVRLRIEGRIGRPSMEETPRNRALWEQARAIGNELGLDLRAARAGGGSDGNTTSQFTATLDGLGPVGDGAHAEHEFLFIDKTLNRTALLALLLMAPTQ